MFPYNLMNKYQQQKLHTGVKINLPRPAQKLYKHFGTNKKNIIQKCSNNYKKKNFTKYTVYCEMKKSSLLSYFYIVAFLSVQRNCI